MTNRGMIVFYLLLLLVTVGATTITLAKNRQKKLSLNILYIGLLLMAWQMLELGMYAVPGTGVALYLSTLRLPLMDLAAMAFLMFALALYNMHTYRTPVIVGMLYIIPAISVVLALISPLHTYYYEAVEVLQREPLLLIELHFGAWFWVRAGFCFGVGVMVLGIALQQIKRLPPRFRGASMLLITGALFCVFSGAGMLWRDMAAIQDSLLLLGFTITFFLLCFSTNTSLKQDAYVQARIDAYDELDEAVWILDDRGRVINRNIAAKYLQYFGNVETGEQDFERVREGIFAGCQQVVHGDGYDNVDYFLPERGHTRIYNLRRRPILDVHGDKIGEMVFCEDMTRLRERMLRLEMEEGLDPFTGLVSKAALTTYLLELDERGTYPCAVLVCRLQEYSRRPGDALPDPDVMLRVAAASVSACAPPNACIARLEQDVMLVVAPGFSHARALRLAQDIQAYTLRRDEISRAYRVVFGVHVRESASVSIGDVMYAAIEDMRVSAMELEHAAEDTLEESLRRVLRPRLGR